MILSISPTFGIFGTSRGTELVQKGDKIIFIFYIYYMFKDVMEHHQYVKKLSADSGLSG